MPAIGEWLQPGHGFECLSTGPKSAILGIGGEALGGIQSNYHMGLHMLLGLFKLVSQHFDYGEHVVVLQKVRCVC